jgi:hypothetical protein
MEPVSGARQPPEPQDLHSKDAVESRRSFGLIGAGEASTRHQGAPQAFMHRTGTLDYGIILSGEISLIVDKGEILCHERHVIIQQGTSRAWANRPTAVSRIAFILIDGVLDDSLRRRASG